MTAASPADVSWYFNTAGVHANEGYRWLAWEPQDDASTAEFVLHAPLAGTPLLDLTSERTPSIVLGRMRDGSFVFFANRLILSAAPEKGDYQNRAISASVLGVSASGTDPHPLITAAAAAFDEELARLLPLRWTAGNPAIDPAAGQWPPSPRGSSPMPPEQDLQESIGMPLAERASVTVALTGLATLNLEDVPRDHILALLTDVLDQGQLRRLRPWRVVSPEVEEQVTFSRDPKSGPWQLPQKYWQLPRKYRRVILISIGCAVVVALAVWAISRWRRG